MLSTTATNAQKEIDAAYEICRLHAAVDGAFAPALMRHWFEAAWALCADFTSFIYPQRQFSETVTPDPMTGEIRLSHEPSGPVQVYSGSAFMGTLPPDARVFGGPAWSQLDLCCLCNLTLRYPIGEEGPCGKVPPSFVQAVARVFAYIVENRGDVEMDQAILSKCGAMAWLDVTYVL